MTDEEIIQQILSKHPEISRNEVLENLKTEKHRTGNLIADTTLLRLVAARYGVETSQDRVYDHMLSISDLVPNLNDVTVAGRVVAVYPSRTFEGKKPGKYASLMITDKDSLLRVMLWNDMADLVEAGKLKAGQIVRFSHGYTREDFSGKAELHLGGKSEIEIEPQNEKAEEYPSIDRFATKIREIAKTHRNIHVTGAVKKIFPSSTFTRSDTSAGTVLRLMLADCTGEIPVVVWNEKAEELEKTLKMNACLELVNAKVKAGSNGVFEVHVDSYTYVGVSGAVEQLTKIASLTENLNGVNVEGEVSTVPESKEVTTSKGETVKLAVFELRDGTGAIRVSAWRKHAEDVVSLKVGDCVLVENAYVRRGYGDKLELSTREATCITVRAI